MLNRFLEEENAKTKSEKICERKRSHWERQVFLKNNGSYNYKASMKVKGQK